MENASKALIMAGGVLLAMLVLSLFAYVFKDMQGSTSNIYKIMNAAEIAEFNQKFLNYDERGIDIYIDDEGNQQPKNPLNVHDVVTIANTAKDNNEQGKYPVYVTVELYDSSGNIIYDNAETLGAEELNEFMLLNIRNSYSCTVEYDNVTPELIGKIIIRQL